MCCCDMNLTYFALSWHLTESCTPGNSIIQDVCVFIWPSVRMLLVLIKLVARVNGAKVDSGCCSWLQMWWDRTWCHVLKVVDSSELTLWKLYGFCLNACICTWSRPEGLYLTSKYEPPGDLGRETLAASPEINYGQQWWRTGVSEFANSIVCLCVCLRLHMETHTFIFLHKVSALWGFRAQNSFNKHVFFLAHASKFISEKKSYIYMYHVVVKFPRCWNRC